MGRELQDLNLKAINDTDVDKIFFNPAGLHLHMGCEIIDFRRRILYEKTDDPLPVPTPSGIHARGDWILHGDKLVLWLPSDYRCSCSDSRDGTIALGHESGRVTFLRFDETAL
jgi:hypothetical protein